MLLQDLISFLLLVFNIGIFHHKKKILGLWPHCPGVRSRQVKKTHYVKCVCVCVCVCERERERETETEAGVGLGACEAHQAQPTHDAHIRLCSLVYLPGLYQKLFPLLFTTDL